MTRAANVLTGRLLAMERIPEAQRDDTWWAGYVATCEALARLIQVTRGATWGGVGDAEPRRRVGKVG